MNGQQIPFIPYLPNGAPAPAVLTAQEAAEFLRLSGDGERCLKYYRDTGLLIGVRIGRSIRYPLSELLNFLERKTKSVGVVGQR